MDSSLLFLFLFLLSLQTALVSSKMRHKPLYYERRLNLPRSTKQMPHEQDAQKDPAMFFKQAAHRMLEGDLGSVSTEDDPEKVACLGRPFQIGNFYDARTGRLMIANSPWSSETVKNTTESKIESTLFLTTDSNTLENDMKFFDMDPSLQAQFLHGEIKVSGSAKFLKAERKTNRIVRTVMQYKDIAKFVTLKSGALNRVDYPHMLRKMRKVATHVVTGLEMGVRAVLVFERKLKEGENRVKANQELFKQVKEIPQTDFNNITHEINMTDDQFKNVKNCSAKFFGDFLLSNPPLSYWEALYLYHRLPNLMETARLTPVALSAYMFPLAKLFEYSNLTNDDPESHQVKVEQVPMDLRDQLLDLFEHIDDIQREIETIKDRNVTRFHTRIWDQLTIFADHLEIYEIHMKSEMTPLVPLIIQGNVTAPEAEAEVRKILDADRKSPFSTKNMRKWIREKEEEVDVLMAKMDMPNRCIHEGNFAAMLHHPNHTYTAALVLKIGHYNDPYLELLNEYLDTKQPAVYEYEGLNDALHWWDPEDETQSAMFKKSAAMQEWIRLEEKRAKRGLQQSINFAIREVLLEHGETPHVKLELYRDGARIDPNYEIPSKPGRPVLVNKGKTWVRLSWEEPEEGSMNIGAYEIETMMANATVMNQTENFDQSVIDSCGKFLCHLRTDFAYDNEENLIEDLKPGTEYKFRVVVYSKYHHPSAVSPISDPVTTDFLGRNVKTDEL